MDEQVWQKMSTEILMDLKEWRKANPRATYVQIEDEVHKRVMQLEARLILLQMLRQLTPLLLVIDRSEGLIALLCLLA